MRRTIVLIVIFLLNSVEIFPQIIGGGFGLHKTTNVSQYGIQVVDNPVYSGLGALKSELTPGTSITLAPSFSVKKAIPQIAAGERVRFRATFDSGFDTPEVTISLKGQGYLEQSSTSYIIIQKTPGWTLYESNFNRTGFNADTLIFGFETTNLQGKKVVIIDQVEILYQNGTSVLVEGGESTQIVTTQTPILIAPMNGATNTGTNITFSCGAITGATYILQISTDPNFASFFLNQSGQFPSYVVSGLSSNTTYYWRMNAIAPGQQISLWSSVWSFNTGADIVLSPTLTSPLNSAINQPIDILFGWYSVPGGSDNLQVSTTSDFSTTVVNHVGITTGSYLVSNLPANTTMYWRVRRVLGGQTSTWSSIWSFTTGSGIQNPGIFSGFTNLTNGQANVSLTPTMNWTPVSGYALEVRILLDPSGMQSYSGVFIAGVGSLTVNPSLVCGTNYMVQARWTGETVNDWSPVIRFSTISCGISIPKLTEPANNAPNQSLTPILRWVSDSGASDRVQISTLNGTVVEDRSNLMDKNYTISSGKLLYNTTYLWRVRSTKEGITTDWSETFRFTTMDGFLTPGNTILISPSNNSTGKDFASVTLMWLRGSNSPECEYRVAKSSVFTNPVFSGVVSTTQTVIQNLEPATTYYWQVRGKNGTAYGDWSSTSNFMTKGGITSVEDNNVPTEFRLEQNYPNPFNPSTKIRFGLKNSEFVSLKVYNTLGQEIAKLVNSEMPIGLHEIQFDGSKFSSGIYIYKIQAGNFSSTKKMILSK